MRKKFLSALLAFAMVLSLLPATVWADEAPVARVNNTDFPSIQAAIADDNTKDGATVSLLRTVDVTEPITVDKNIRLELRGNAINLQANSQLILKAEVTIIGGSNNGSIGSIVQDSRSTAESALQVGGADFSGKVTIQGAEIRSPKGIGVLVMNSGSTLNVENNSTITGTSQSCGVYLDSATLNFKSGEIKGGIGIVVENGTLNMEGGTASTDGNGNITVKSATSAAAGIAIDGSGSGDFNITISGGTVGKNSSNTPMSWWGGATVSDTVRSRIKITAGATFSQAVDDFLVPSAQQSVEQQDGTYKVAEQGASSPPESNHVAEVDGKYYTTLEKAIEAFSRTSKTITLVQSVNGDTASNDHSGNLLVRKTLTIDLNGKTLDLGSGAITVDSSNGKLTIQDLEKSSWGVTSAGTRTVIVQGGGHLTVDGVAITNESKSGSDAVAILIRDDYSSVDIKGGTVKVEAATNNSVAIYQRDAGTLNISDRIEISDESEIRNESEISGKAGIVARAGTINVSGGSIIQATGSSDITIGTYSSADYINRVRPAGIVLAQSDAKSGSVALNIESDKNQKVQVRAAAGKDAIAYTMNGNLQTAKSGPSGANVTIKDHSIFSSDVSKYVNTVTDTGFLTEKQEVIPVGEDFIVVSTAPEMQAIVIHKDGGNITYTYYTLQDAIGAAQEGDIISLLKDVDDTEGIAINNQKPITLDLGTHTITGTLTIKTDADVTLKGGAITSTTSSGIVVDGGKLTVESGTITGGTYGIEVKSGTLIVKDGNISGPTALHFSSPPTSNTEITGGTFTGTGEEGKAVTVNGAVDKGKGFISGGTFLCDGTKKFEVDETYLTDDAVQQDNGTVISPAITLTFQINIDDGKFKDDETGTKTQKMVRIIKGGTLSTEDLPTVIPTKDNQVFDDWYTNETEVDGEEPFDFTQPLEESITVYARWKPTFGVIFDLHGGNIAGVAKNLTVQTNKYGKLSESDIPADPVREGFTFEGWYTAEKDGDWVDFTTRVFTKTTRVHAHWKRVVFTIHFTFKPGEEGTLAEGEDTATTGTDSKLTDLPTPTRDHYAFDGWFMGDSDGCKLGKEEDEGCVEVTTDTVFTEEDASDDEGNATVHAHWHKIPPYDITFDLNYEPEEGSSTHAKLITGDDGRLLNREFSAIPKPDRTDYSFVGWYTEKTGGDPVSASTQFYKDTTVYAHWQNQEPVITFHANGGEFRDEGNENAHEDVDGWVTTRKADEKGYLAEEKWPADLADITRDGKLVSFAGWYTAPTGGEKVSTGRHFTDNEHLYAHWGYEILFDLNDGSSDESGETPEGGGAPDSGEAPEAGGAPESGEAPEGGGTPESGETPETGDTTESKYYYRGVTEEDGKLKVWPDEPTRDGYKFVGWYNDDLNGNKFGEESQFTQRIILYAHWAEVVTLTASPAEMTIGSSAVNKITLTASAEFASTVAKEHFTLSGTALGSLTVTEVELNSEDPTKVTITLSAAPSTEGTLTITVAQQAFGKALAKDPSVDITVKAAGSDVKPTYTITFDLNYEGAPDPETKTTDESGKLDALPAPTRDGYTFDGWYTEKTGGDPKGADSVFTEDTTLYAHWTPKSGGEDDPNKPGDPSNPDDPSKPDVKKEVYEIWVSNSRHGKVSVDSFAEEKSWVTITVTPDTDYEVDSVEVKPVSGSSIWPSRSGSQYSFTMPSSDVTVIVKFSLLSAYSYFTPPQPSQSQSQSQANTKTPLPASAFTPVTSRPSAAMWDLPASSWAYPAAQWAYRNGYLDTAIDGSFQLNGTVSHMQLWKIMARWLGQTALDDNSVSQWARQSGAFRVGTASGAMTRQNMVEYLYQCYFLMGGDVSVTGNLIQYRDSQLVTAASARNAWLWAVGKGIISGTTDGYLNPNGVLNRGEFATILMRLCQNG